MRFAFVLPHFDETRNSFSKLLVPICAALRQRGDEVHIFSANQGYRGALASLHHVIACPRLKPHFLYQLAFLAAATRALRRADRVQRYDVIHNLGCGSALHQNVITAHACHAEWVRRKAIYGESWLVWLNPTHAITLAVEWLNYRRRPLAVLAVSRPIAREVLRYHPRTAGRLHLVENGLGARLLTTPPPMATKYPNFTIIFASNDHRKKGLLFILKALRLATDQGHSWRVVVLGVDPKRAVMDFHVESLGLQGAVEFRGHVDDVVGEMAKGSVFCLPSKYEPFGMVMLEAAQAGLPIVATAEGVYPDLVAGFDTGFELSHPVDERALFAALLRVATDAAYAARLAEHVREKARAYTERRMVEETLKVYDAVTAAIPR